MKSDPTSHLTADQKWQQIEAGFRDAVRKPRHAARLINDMLRDIRTLLEAKGIGKNSQLESVNLKISELQETVNSLTETVAKMNSEDDLEVKLEEEYEAQAEAKLEANLEAEYEAQVQKPVPVTPPKSNKPPIN